MSGREHRVARVDSGCEPRHSGGRLHVDVDGFEASAAEIGLMPEAGAVAIL